MRFRKTLTFLMLVTALVFALPAWAEQKSVGASGAGPRPNAVRPYVACAAAVLTPPGVSQKFVAPTFRSARADVAASLPRHGGVKPPLRYAALKGGATTATSAKPFTQEQVVSMVRDGFGDESGAKLIEQRGIDFAPVRGLSPNPQGRRRKRGISERPARRRSAGLEPGRERSADLEVGTC